MSGGKESTSRGGRLLDTLEGSDGTAKRALSSAQYDLLCERGRALYEAVSYGLRMNKEVPLFAVVDTDLEEPSNRTTSRAQPSELEENRLLRSAAMEQENVALRRALRASQSASESAIRRMEDLQRENEHLKKKVKIFRSEMQRQKMVVTQRTSYSVGPSTTMRSTELDSPSSRTKPLGTAVQQGLSAAVGQTPAAASEGISLAAAKAAASASDVLSRISNASMGALDDTRRGSSVQSKSSSNTSPFSAHQRENAHLRRLLAERDILCAGLKSSLENAAQEQEQADAEIQQLRKKVAFMTSELAKRVLVTETDPTLNDPDELPMPSRAEALAQRQEEWEEEEKRYSGEATASEESLSMLSVWSQVLFGT